MATTEKVMAKSKKKAEEPGGEMLVPLNTRAPKPLVERLDRVSALLGTDRSHLLRMMLVKYLPVYEAEAGIAAG
jgi:hypothetical protein